MDRKKDLYFKRNVLGVASVELFWGFGFPIVLESTFLQLFLRHLGASSFLIGIVPALFLFCVATQPVLANYLTRNIRFKQNAVFLGHLIPSIAIFLLGLVMLTVEMDKQATIVLFFVFYTIFSMTLGFGIPIWFNYLAKIFSEARTVPGLGYMMLAQNVGKVISSFFILKVVERYAFSPQSCAYIFLFTGTVFMVGSSCFKFTMELADKHEPEPDTAGFLPHTLSSLKEIIANKAFLIFLIADLDFYIVVTVLSFYANYATEFFEVNQAIAAGMFVACIYAGSIMVNILLGTMDILSLKGKLIFSKCASLICLFLLITIPWQWCFFLISFLLGIGRAVHNIVYTPSVKKLSGKMDATSYFSMAPLLTAPVGFGFPVVFGYLLDRFAYLGADSYRLLFVGAGLLLLVTFWFTLKLDYSSKTATK